MAIEADFTIVLRGYDRGQVDALLRQVDDALASTDLTVREAAAEAVRGATFEMVMRGYDRDQVDQLLRRLPAELVSPLGWTGDASG